MAPQRTKNPAIVQSKVNSQAAAFSSNIVTESTDNLAKQNAYLENIFRKRQMGIISEDDYRVLISSQRGKAVEKASMHILKNILSYSEFDPNLQAIYATVGSHPTVTFGAAHERALGLGSELG